MLWYKAIHVIFVVTWFAGLFYLPRLFVHHAESTEPAVHARLKIMERRLLVMTHIGAVGALVFGMMTLMAMVRFNPEYMKQGWMHAKLALVFALVVYHFLLTSMTRRFAADANTRSPRWLRIFNEMPALALIGIVILVVVKPF